MSRLKLNSKAILIIISICFFGVNGIPQTVDSSNLTEKKISITVQQKNFQHILSQLSRKNNIPIGLQISDQKEPKSCDQKLTLQFQKSDLSYIMNSLVSVCPIYTWKFVDGTVNIYPVVKEESLLDIRVSKLILNKKTADEILNKIFTTKEVEDYLHQNSLLRDTTTSSLQGSNKNDSKYSSNLSDKEVRDLMNYIIVNTDNNFWIYYKLSDNKSSFSLRMF